MPLDTYSCLAIGALRRRYRERSLSPSTLVRDVVARIDAAADPAIWIHRVPLDALLARAAALEAQDPEQLPLYGIPFAIKDNIDLAGHPTTAACPAFAYVPERSATVVEKLLAAGAIAIGKTNLDQFAAGLVGVRSPYGACRNPFDARFVAGGSSAGSAAAVSLGQVSFALGTDTAGSGRVPAAFCNIVGLKPTRGRLSTRGVVPACRTLDCVSIFALTADDATIVLNEAEGLDEEDPFSNAPDHRSPPVPPRAFVGVRVGIPRARDLAFFGNAHAEQLYRQSVGRIEAMGGQLIEVDFTPFLAAAQLLYEGPWVAERTHAIRAFLDAHADALQPVTRTIIEGGRRHSAIDTFDAQYRLQSLRREADRAWRAFDVLVTPTAGTIYSIEAVNANPIQLNSNLGYYTNFVNLLDLCGIAIPAGFQADGLPFGVTLLAPAGADRFVSELGARLHAATAVPLLGATSHSLPKREDRFPTATRAVNIAVCGAHMSGLPLNYELTGRGACLARACRTAAEYRLFALERFTPPRPGMVRGQPGVAIEVEVWQLSEQAFGSFVATIPAPLGIGTITLEDGATVQGFLCEGYATIGARDISLHGGWRAWLASLGR